MNPQFRQWLPATLSLLMVAGLAYWLRLQVDTFGGAIVRLHEIAETAPWIVIIAFAFRPFVLFPISLLVISCGLLFDAPSAYLLGFVGQWLSGMTGYALVRMVVPHDENRDHSGLIAKWQDRLASEAFTSVLMMRVLLLPYDAINYGCALLRAPSRPYAVATAVGIIPANIALVSLGQSINIEAFSDGQTGLSLQQLLDPQQLALSALLVAISLLVAGRLKRKGH